MKCLHVRVMETKEFPNLSDRIFAVDSVETRKDGSRLFSLITENDHVIERVPCRLIEDLQSPRSELSSQKK